VMQSNAMGEQLIEVGAHRWIVLGRPADKQLTRARIITDKPTDRAAACANEFSTMDPTTLGHRDGMELETVHQELSTNRARIGTIGQSSGKRV